MVPRRRKQKKLPTKVVDDESEDIESPEPTAGEDVDLSAYDSSDEDRREGQPDRPKEENRRCLPTAEELVRKHLATGILPKDMAGLEVTTIEAERRSTAPLDGVGQEDSQDQTPVLSAFGVMVPAWVNGRLAAEYITPTSLPEMHMSVSDWRTMGIPIGLAKLIEASVRTKRPRAGEPEEQDDPEVKRTRLAERKVPMSRPDWLQAIEGKDLDDGKPFVSMFEKQMAVHKWAEDNWPQLFLLTFPRPGSAEDTRWPRAREWIQAATNAGELENWEKTKESFLKSFKSVVGQRVQLLNELHKAHQKKDETVQGFINRLLNVASRYNIEPEGPHNLVDYLMRGVNVEIRQAMHREVQARQIDTDQVNWTMAV